MIKSNNPHLAGGEKRKPFSAVFSFLFFVLVRFVFFCYSVSLFACIFFGFAFAFFAFVFCSVFVSVIWKTIRDSLSGFLKSTHVSLGRTCFLSRTNGSRPVRPVASRIQGSNGNLADSKPPKRQLRSPELGWVCGGSDDHVWWMWMFY